VHDPSAEEPRCRLQDEDGDEYGAVIPEAGIADAIRERTELHLRKLGATVSSKVGLHCVLGRHKAPAFSWGVSTFPFLPAADCDAGRVCICAKPHADRHAWFHLEGM
jgi:hypothetical protein